jgi:hypothetical protein
VSVAWFDGVTITVEVAFTTAPLATTPTWTDVSAYVRGIEIDRGRSDEFSKFGPGTCAVTFSNRDRRFDPEYAAGAYFGNLNPMKKIRVRATYSATTYDLFVGFVQGWPQAYEFTFDSTVTVQCVDGSRILESSTLNRSAYEAAVLADGPMAYYPLQGENTYEDALGGSALSPSGTWGAGSSTGVIGADESLVPTERQFVTPGSEAYLTSSAPVPSAPLSLDAWVFMSGVPNVSDFHYFQINGGLDTTSNWIYVRYSYLFGWKVNVKNAAINRWYATTAGVTGTAVGWHHLAVTLDASTVAIYLDGALLWSAAPVVGTAGLTEGPASVLLSCRVNTTVTPQADALAHVAFYPTTLSAARITEHYLAGIAAYGHPYGERSGGRVGRVLDEAGWPAADRTLSTGDTVHGPYIPDRQSAMGYMQDAETAEDGYLFIGKNGNVVLRDRNWQWTQASVGTFSDDGSDIPYEAITIDANSLEPLRTAVSVTYGPNDAYLKVEDATAKTAYGPAFEALSTPTLDSSLTARSLAQYRLRAWKDPSTRITELTVQPRAKAATAYPVVLALELGDRITVERTPGNPVVGSQIVKSLTVQGISHSIDVDGTWLTTLYLSPAPALGTAVPYLIVGDATYGQIGAGPGNKIPF